MNAQWIVLDKIKHAQFGWKSGSDYRFAEGRRAVPVYVDELAALTVHYPLCFVKEGEKFTLSILVGLQGMKNVFVNEDGIWRYGYIPSSLRAYPFSFLNLKTEEGNKKVLCFDESSGFLRKKPESCKGEELFFDETGNPGETLKKLLAFLHARDKSAAKTQNAVEMLQYYDLLEKWELVENRHDNKQSFYRIDQNKLNELPADILKTLQKNNALLIAYAQIFSMPMVSMLKKLENNVTVPVPDKMTEVDDVSAFFGEEDETIKFNF